MADGLTDALFVLRETAAEALKLEQALQSINDNPDALGGIMGWITVQGLASAVEKIYCGCERALLIIAKTVDGEAIQTTDGWHRALILRMANP